MARSRCEALAVGGRQRRSSALPHCPTPGSGRVRSVGAGPAGPDQGLGSLHRLYQRASGGGARPLLGAPGPRLRRLGTALRGGESDRAVVVGTGGSAVRALARVSGRGLRPGRTGEADAAGTIRRPRGAAVGSGERGGPVSTLLSKLAGSLGRAVDLCTRGRGGTHE